MFGLALPVLMDGFWPVSWLAAFVPNPASGAVLVGLLLAATAWVAASFLQGRAKDAWGGVALAVVLASVAVDRGVGPGRRPPSRRA